MFRFLVTTDNHLGYKERDGRQQLDSYITFEECLRAARCDFSTDAMLLSGDLFHENKPSMGCMKQTMSIMRKYVMGDKPIEFSMVSDPAVSFDRHPLPCANFQDPNSNIALPIFSIHGNHDDPVGGTGSLDILAHSGLINYFGSHDNLDDIVVRPILLKKGDTHVALYGLGNIRDERLHRCFELQKIRFVQPKEEPEKWFKVLLFHQNRGVRAAGSKNGIHESMLYGFKFDLVIWGNEHEQSMAPQSAGNNEFDVVQPGSTIRTSLTANESNPKMFGVLEVKGKDYRMTAYPLNSIRPAVRRTIELRRLKPAKNLEAVEDCLRSVADEMIDEAQELVSQIPKDVLRVHPNIKFPLMRLAVDYHDPDGAPYPQPNANRFGQQFLDVVVNPEDCLKAVKAPPQPRNQTALSGHSGQVAAPIPDAGVSVSDIRTKIATVFNANAQAACNLLSEPEVSTAVYSFVEKSETNAIDTKIEDLIKQSQVSLWKKLRETTELDRGEILKLAVANKETVNKKFADQHGNNPKPDTPAIAAVGDLPLGAPLPRSHAELPAADEVNDFDNHVGVVPNVAGSQLQPINLDDDAEQMEAVIQQCQDAEALAVVEAAKASNAKPKKAAGAKRGRKAAGEDGETAPKARTKKEKAAAGPTLSLSTGGGGGAPDQSAAQKLMAKW